MLLCGTIVYAQKQISAASPDGQIRVTISLSDRIYYDVESHGEKLFGECHIGLTLRNRTLGEKPVLKSSQKILKEADYVARTKGNRSFPWRYMLIS